MAASWAASAPPVSESQARGDAASRVGHPPPLGSTLGRQWAPFLDQEEEDAAASPLAHPPPQGSTLGREWAPPLNREEKEEMCPVCLLEMTDAASPSQQDSSLGAQHTVRVDCRLDGLLWALVMGPVEESPAAGKASSSFSPLVQHASSLLQQDSCIQYMASRSEELLQALVMGPVEEPRGVGKASSSFSSLVSSPLQQDCCVQHMASLSEELLQALVMGPVLKPWGVGKGSFFFSPLVHHASSQPQQDSSVPRMLRAACRLEELNQALVMTSFP